MAANSKIEWTDVTWNPIRARNTTTGKVGWHCVKVSRELDEREARQESARKRREAEAAMSPQERAQAKGLLFE